MIPPDLTGLQFGRLTVVGRMGSNAHRESVWRCKCVCGNESVVTRSNLRNGNTTSCGCYGKERKSAANKTHGDTGTRLYRIWKAMRTRCYNPNSPAFQYYGRRGISICEQWKRSYTSFRAWAAANGYRDELTIDRINVNKGYSPDNCRWVTMAEQNKNKRCPNGTKLEEGYK